jgi:hypothetical protein
MQLRTYICEKSSIRLCGPLRPCAPLAPPRTPRPPAPRAPPAPLDPCALEHQRPGETVSSASLTPQCLSVGCSVVECH